MRGRLLASVVLLSLALAGCGGTDDGAKAAPDPSADNGVANLPAEQIVDRAVEAAKSAKSVHIAGGVDLGDGTIVMDLRISGADARGTLKTDDGPMEIVKVSGQVHMRAETGYWKQAIPGRDAAFYRSLKGKWVKAAAGAFGGFGQLTNVSKLLQPPAKSWIKGGVRRELHLPPKPAVVTVHSDTDYHMGVLIHGKPYPYEFSFPWAAGELNLTEWDQPVTVEAPAAGDIVDVPVAS